MQVFSLHISSPSSPSQCSHSFLQPRAQMHAAVSCELPPLVLELLALAQDGLLLLEGELLTLVQEVLPALAQDGLQLPALAQEVLTLVQEVLPLEVELRVLQRVLGLPGEAVLALLAWQVAQAAQLLQ